MRRLKGKLRQPSVNDARDGFGLCDVPDAFDRVAAGIPGPHPEFVEREGPRIGQAIEIGIPSSPTATASNFGALAIHFRLAIDDATKSPSPSGSGRPSFHAGVG